MLLAIINLQSVRFVILFSHCLYFKILTIELIKFLIKEKLKLKQKGRELRIGVFEHINFYS